MAGLARKLIIIAAVDGLIVQPFYTNSPRSNSSSSSNNPYPVSSGYLQIDYKTNRIHSPPKISDYRQRTDERLESHGLVGLLSVASYSFLISITQRQQVAQILGKPIYVITGVSIIPLSSQEAAAKAISQAARAIRNDESKAKSTAEANDSDSDVGLSEDSLAEPPSPDREVYFPPVDEPGEESSIAEDVIQKRGRYGRFAEEWFSKKGWARENYPSAASGFIGRSRSPFASASATDGPTGVDCMELDDLRASAREKFSSVTRTDGSSESRNYDELMPKLLKYTKMMLGSRSFYFSYEYDITRRFGPTAAQPSHTMPLCQQADPLYFWNRHLMQPFIDGGMNTIALPIMQGFIGQQEFTAHKISKVDIKDESGAVDGAQATSTNPVTDTENPSEGQNFLLTLLSRRSVKRSGLRYLRRGVDDEGNVANSVETEQILSSPNWSSADKVYSLLQLRGSIPLYFSQSPYYFKPVPVLRHSAQINQTSFDKHLHDIGRRYGKVHAVCLLDKHGVEVNIGETYERYINNFNTSGGFGGGPVGYEWFDFHSECRGMKFENVKRLVERMTSTLDEFKDTIVQDGNVIQSQVGVVRTNCMDCLDRTGVTQCAFGQRALEQQLEREGYGLDFQTSAATMWFNTLWADNGDAISKQYSSTAALKGDYTRTRKRDYRGALNDLGLTLSRYFNNLITDYFSQACINYLLGDVTIRVFDEFEMDLESADPGISMEKARQNAIETSCKIVISDETEELIGGWTMLSPRQPNTLRTLPFEQSVLLLTDAAVYSCRFDCNTEKVTSFERVDLRSITGIKYGTYINSTLTEAQMDEKRNVGLVIAYKADRSNILRINTRSLQSLFDRTLPSDREGSDGDSKREVLDWDLSTLFGGLNKASARFIAFKLPRTTSAVSNVPQGAEISELDTVRAICADVERMVMGADHPEKPSIVEETDLISLEDARKQTGLLEQVFFDVKKLVWA
ncbi:hypothetical protein FQN57_000101 [Myotisia sp. PD_48]|nr:hypothetical protein FQN57_000101 [Myotisia sp. PD_48]